jgi:hypothetical protein
LGSLPSLVTLSAAKGKGLTRWGQRSFAEFTLERSEGLRMTARTPLKSAHGKPYLQMSSCEFHVLGQRRLQEVHPAVMRRDIYPQGGNQYGRRGRAVFVKQARQEEYPDTIDRWLLIC